MIKGAPVTPEASTISGASATTEVQNNSAEVQNNSASASDPVDAEAPAKILIPLEHWRRGPKIKYCKRHLWMIPSTISAQICQM